MASSNRYKNRLSGMVDDYSNVRTVPAAVSGAFLALSLFTFGGIDPVVFNWVNYTFQPAHATWGSLVAYLLAFMSSDTSDFQHYSRGEQVAIVAGPATIIGWHYFQPVQDLFLTLGTPTGAQVAFLVTAVSWAATQR